MGALVVVVVFGALLTAAVFQSVLVTGQERIDDTRREIEVAQRSLQRERAALAAAESSERLAARAAAIGMVAPGERDWIPAGPTVGHGDLTDSPSGTDDTDDGAPTSELAAPPTSEQGTAGTR